MIFLETHLKDAYTVEIQRLEDDRGFFARSWCQNEFQDHGLNPRLVQCDISYNLKKGTLRGMHYQAAPYEEAKLVRCTMGSIFDVIIDLRPDLPSYKKYLGVDKPEKSRKMLYVPEGFAHGFITLSDQAEVFYQMSEFYTPSAARGIRWNDPAFHIEWPKPVQVISERDASYPDFVG